MWRPQFFISASKSFCEPLWKVLSKNTHRTPRNKAQCVSTWLIKFLGECCRHQTTLIIVNNEHLQFLILFIFLRVKIKKQMNHRKQRPMRKQNPYQSNKVSNKLFMSIQRLSAQNICTLHRAVNKIVLPNALPGADLVFYLWKKLRTPNSHWPQTNDLLQNHEHYPTIKGNKLSSTLSLPELVCFNQLV